MPSASFFTDISCVADTPCSLLARRRSIFSTPTRKSFDIFEFGVLYNAHTLESHSTEACGSSLTLLPSRRWKSDVNSYPQLDKQRVRGPTYEYEYSTRKAYGGSVPGWGPNDPLNATWWHLVTEGTSHYCHVGGGQPTCRCVVLHRLTCSS